MTNCQSCGMPMDKPEDYGGSRTDNAYCRYCTDEQGNLLPRETVRENMIQFMIKSLKKSRGQAEVDVDKHLAMMPAWGGIANQPLSPAGSEEPGQAVPVGDRDQTAPAGDQSAAPAGQSPSMPSDSAVGGTNEPAMTPPPASSVPNLPDDALSSSSPAAGGDDQFSPGPAVEDSAASSLEIAPGGATDDSPSGPKTVGVAALKPEDGTPTT